MSTAFDDDFGFNVLVDGEDPGNSDKELGFQVITADKDKPTEQEQPKKEGGFLQSLEDNEYLTKFKEFSRLGLQGGLGLAKRFTYPADIASSYSYFQQLPLELQRKIKEKGSNLTDEEVKQVYDDLAKKHELFPTQENIEAGIEKQTGLPLTPQNRLERGVRQFGQGVGLFGGSPAQSLGAGAGVESVAEILIEMGVPEEYARKLAGVPRLARELMNFKGAKPISPTAGQIEQQQAQGLTGGVPSTPGGPPPSPLSTRTSQDVTPILKFLQGEERYASNVATGLEQQLSQPPIEKATQGRLPTEQPRGTLEGRNITQQEQSNMGLRPVAQPVQPSPQARLDNDIGNIFSPLQFYNTTQGGQALTGEIRQLDNQAYGLVNQLYARSRELNSAEEAPRQDLVNDLMALRANLEGIPSPSTPQSTLLRSLNETLGRLATYNVNQDTGQLDITGYLPISNQQLIDQIQAWRSQIDYDFEHGDKRNIYLPGIQAIENDIVNNTQDPEAVEAFNDARSGYAMWAQRFDNPYVRPFRDTSNEDYSKLFKGSLDLDEYNYLNNILHQSDRGDQLSHALSREIVGKRLKKYIDKPSSASGPEFEKEMREIASFATPDQLEAINQQFSNARKGEFKAVQLATPPSKVELKAAKYLDKEWEDVYKLTTSTAGRKELKRDLFKVPEYYDMIMRHRIKDILHQGEISKDFTGTDLAKILNKTENYELLSDYLGEEAVIEAKKIAKQRGDQEVLKGKKLDFKRKATKQIIQHAVSNSIVRLIFGLAL